MNRKQLADRIGNIDDRLVQQAEDVPNYARLRREKRLKRLAGMAACSGAVGALAFSRETVTEVPAEQEQVVLREIGVTLLLPDSWKGRYEVVEDTFAPYGSAMWEFCVRSVYEAKTPIEGAGGSFYRGNLRRGALRASDSTCLRRRTLPMRCCTQAISSSIRRMRNSSRNGIPWRSPRRTSALCCPTCCREPCAAAHGAARGSETRGARRG